MPRWPTHEWGAPAVYKLEPRERMARVEEELERQHELMREGSARMEKRLEQMDKRFATMQASTDERFDRMKFFALAFATGSGAIIAAMRWP